MNVLRVRGLRVERPDKVPLVDDVSFDVPPRQIVGLVGESGSGKTLSALAVLDLLPAGLTRTAGQLELDGRALTPADRGRTVSMVFQDPSTALNPVLTLGAQLFEVLSIHRQLHGDGARREAISLLTRVGFPEPEARLKFWPHQLSGGQRQRALIALALAGRPRLLIADEPTTALDVTVQAQVLQLLDSLRKTQELSVLLITHDLGVVTELCDQVVVLYASRVVETGPVEAVLERPRHPYTAALIRARPKLGAAVAQPLKGQVPAPGQRPRGCVFYDRCERHQDDCTAAQPPLKEGFACLHPLP